LASKLINDLTKVPNIIADLGLGIANAQKQLNAGYVDSLRALVELAVKLKPDGTNADSSKFAAELLMNLAPPRYQFTETELTVQLDLAQSTDTAKEGALGVAMGAFVVNAAYSSDFSQDYRAAAECRTVIHAVLPSSDNRALFDSLLARAKEIDAAKADLPARSEFDNNVLESATALTKTIAPGA
jgi:hypothetical protein